jgi:hypothetical protein
MIIFLASNNVDDDTVNDDDDDHGGGSEIYHQCRDPRSNIKSKMFHPILYYVIFSSCDAKKWLSPWESFDKMSLGTMNVGDNDDAILILHWMHTGMLLLVPKYNEWCCVWGWCRFHRCHHRIDDGVVVIVVAVVFVDDDDDGEYYYLMAFIK